MSCEIKVICLFEPINGYYPPSSICGNHSDCFGCQYQYVEYVTDSEVKDNGTQTGKESKGLYA